LAGALPQTPLGELTALPQTPSWILGALLLRKGEGREKRRRGERRRERGGERAMSPPPPVLEEVYAYANRCLF